MTGRRRGRKRPEPVRSRAPLAVRLARLAALATAASLVIGIPAASARGLRSERGSPPSTGPFGWLLPAPAPASWSRAVIPSGEATLAYPPSFAPIISDPGTVSAAVRTGTGAYRAYLNVTPRQGDERLRGFASFRVHLLGEEHNQSVHQETATDGMAFNGGRASCVLDHYITRMGHHHYRELACFVTGRHGAAVVVVAAATTAEWDHFQPLLRRAIASLAVS